MTDFQRGMDYMLRLICRQLAEYREADEVLAEKLKRLESEIKEREG